MKVYLSMPISGYDINERVSHAERAKIALKNLYEEVVTPFDVSPYDPEKSYGQCMKECINELITCDLVIFDEGWYQSNGCRIEAEVARGCEIKMKFM